MSRAVVVALQRELDEVPARFWGLFTPQFDVDGTHGRLEDDLALGRRLRVVDARHFLGLWCRGDGVFGPRGARLLQRVQVWRLWRLAAAQRWSVRLVCVVFRMPRAQTAQ